jgi:hypothetical protein
MAGAFIENTLQPLVAPFDGELAVLYLPSSGCAHVPSQFWVLYQDADFLHEPLR